MKLNFEKYYFIKLKNKALKTLYSIEDILLIMKSQNIMSSIGILDGEQYKFFYTDNKEFLYNRKVIRCRNVVKDNSIQTFFVFDEYSFENLYINNKGVICYNMAFCKHCNSTDVISKDFNTREVLNSHGELKTLKLKRYECKKCGRKSQVELSSVYEPYCKFSNTIKEKFGLFLHNGHKNSQTTC